MADIICSINSTQRVVSATLVSSSRNVAVNVAPNVRTIAMSVQQGIRGPAGPPGADGAAADPITFANSNGVTFGSNAGTVTASVKTDYLTTAAATDHSHGAVAVTNILATSASNGLSLSAPAQSVQTQSRFNLTLSGATAGIMALISSGVMALAGGPNITMSQNGNSVSISGPATHAQQTGISGISAGAASISAGTLVLSNSNGMSFGLNGSTLTGSHNGLTTAAQSNHSHGNPTLALTNLSGTTASASNGLTISLSAALGGGAGDGYNILAAGTQTATTAGSVQFANSNGITFGMSGSTQITASHNALTTAMQSGMTSAFMSTSERGNYFATAGNTFANSTHSHGAPTLNLTNISGTTGSASNGLTLSLSAAAQSVQTQGSVQVQGSSGAVSFGNANGITFGGNASTITASHNGLTTAAQSGHSHGVTLNLTNLSGTTGGNSQGITISLSASAAPAQTVQPVAVSGANGSFAFSTLTLANSNGVSFITGTQGVYATVATNYAASNVTTNNIATANSSLFQHTSATSAITANVMNTSERGNYFATAANTFANSTHSHGNPTLNLTNISGTTGSASNGLTISLSAAAPGAGGGAALSAGTQSANTGTIAFANSNGISFGMSGSNQITASYTVPTQSVQTQSSVQVLGSSGDISFSNSNGITFGGNASTITASHNGLTTAMQSGMTSAFMSTSERANYFATAGNTFANSTHSHGNPTLALTNLTGTTGSNSAGLTISLSAAAPGGGAAIMVSAGTTSGNVQTMVFSNSNGVSFGLNGSTLTASAAGGGGGGAVTVSTLPSREFNRGNGVAAQTLGTNSTRNSLYLFPVSLESHVAFNVVKAIVSLAYVSSSVYGKNSLTSSYGLYTLTGSTMNLMSSGSFSMGFTNSSISGTANFPTTTATSGYGYTTTAWSSTSNMQAMFGTQGNRILGLVFGNSMMLTPGVYWLGIIQRVSTSSANIGVSPCGSIVGGVNNQMYNVAEIGKYSTSHLTNFFLRWPFGGGGVLTSTADYGGTALPSSFHISKISHNHSVVPLLTFIST